MQSAVDLWTPWGRPVKKMMHQRNLSCLKIYPSGKFFWEEWKAFAGSPVDGSTLLLVINETLYFGDRMLHMLLCHKSVGVQWCQHYDAPKAFDPASPHTIANLGQVELPFQISGIISFLRDMEANRRRNLGLWAYWANLSGLLEPLFHPFQQKKRYSANRIPVLYRKMTLQNH